MARPPANLQLAPPPPLPMSFNDDAGRFDSPSYDQDPGHMGLATASDFSYTPSSTEEFRDVAQVATTGRTNWKTLRGKGEAVWPPNLYANSPSHVVRFVSLTMARVGKLLSSKVIIFPAVLRLYQLLTSTPLKHWRNIGPTDSVQQSSRAFHCAINSLVIISSRPRGSAEQPSK